MKLAYWIASGIYCGVSIAGFMIWFNDEPGSHYALVASIVCLAAQLACMNAALNEKESE